LLTSPIDKPAGGRRFPLPIMVVRVHDPVPPNPNYVYNTPGFQRLQLTLPEMDTGILAG
jgi:hypothetical protein